MPGRTGTYRGPEGHKSFMEWLTFWQVWRFANGKVVHGQGFADKAEAFAAAGTSE